METKAAASNHVIIVLASALRGLPASPVPDAKRQERMFLLASSHIWKKRDGMHVVDAEVELMSHEAVANLRVENC